MGYRAQLTWTKCLEITRFNKQPDGKTTAKSLQLLKASDGSFGFSVRDGQLHSTFKLSDGEAMQIAMGIIKEYMFNGGQKTQDQQHQ